MVYAGFMSASDQDPGLSEERQAQLLAHPRWRRLWERGAGASGWQTWRDVAEWAVRAGWTHGEVIDLLTACRRRLGYDSGSLERETCGALAAMAQGAVAMDWVEEALIRALYTPPKDQAEVLKENLSTLFGVDILRIVKYLGDPPSYCMETQQGNVPIGTIDQITSQGKFTHAVSMATNKVIPGVSSRVWKQHVQAILTACEEIEAEDASHPARQTRRWLEEYLLEKPPRTEEWEKAVATKSPYEKDGRLFIFIADFQKWLDNRTATQLGNHAIGRRFRQVGVDREHVNVRIGAARTTRTCWHIPKEILPRRSRGGVHPEDPQ